MATKIKFSVTSLKGDEEYELLPREAVAKLKKLEKEENKWVFINGEIKNTEFITEKDLINAMEDEYEIVCMGAIAGGNMDKVVKIDFEVSKKVKEGIVVSLVENDYAKEIKISVAKDNLIDIIHSREVIIKAIENKLNEFAYREVDGMRKALNVN